MVLKNLKKLYSFQMVEFKAMFLLWLSFLICLSLSLMLLMCRLKSLSE